MKNLNIFINKHNISDARQLGSLLKEHFSIKMREEVNVNGVNLLTFNYDQIESPKMNPIVQECRGLVLLEDLTVAAWCMPRFFNLGEALEVTDHFEWSQPFTVEEKADGSLIKVYHVEGHWEIGTRGTATAMVENYTGMLFRDMVIKALGFASESDFQTNAERCLDVGSTYIFEFTSPDNRVVTPYQKDCMVLLDVIKEGLSLDKVNEFEFFKHWNVRLPNVYLVNNRNDLVKMVNNLEGLQEGFIIKDVNGLRIKVKSEAYVAVHKLRGESIPSTRRIAELVVTNETDEYLAYFPEETRRFKPFVDAWIQFVVDQEIIYNSAKDIESQKDFALAVKDSPLSGAMFGARAKNASFKDELANMRSNSKIDKLLEYINKG
jgi:hypothetical protein